MTDTQTLRDKPWIFRTYAGHSTAEDSNKLYRSNLEKGQTGLSVAFDLPTQTGYDPDHPLAKGEVGKVGVPISHIGDMRNLFKDIPLESMNTSMTINATAPWLLALYVAVAEEQGADVSKLSGTTQNDIIKEYLSRGTYIFPPEPSMRLTIDMITWTYTHMPKWNPMNICSYHLQEAGATPVQEISYALVNAIEILDRVKKSGVLSAEDFPKAAGRISFFVNSGIRFVTEICKMRAFVDLWDEICRERYGIEDEKYRRFRYGVQVNSLGLTEQQPENNVYRILLEMLAVVLSKKGRARAVQLPAWNEALGLPRPWDQQWSLRMQQIVAFETDLLEFEDLFEGSHVINSKVNSLKESVRQEITFIESMGGAVGAVESGYMKSNLVESNSKRLQAIENGATTVIGVNAYTSTEPSPLSAGEGAVMTVSEAVEDEAIERIRLWREKRDQNAVDDALGFLQKAAHDGQNIMEASIHCAKVGVTTGEWGFALRKVWGEYRAPTGVSASASQSDDGLDDIREHIQSVSEKLGRRLKILVGKPGLDGHSNGAEQIAVRARNSGMDVIYEGIRLSPNDIVDAALKDDVDIIGLSVLSGGHISVVKDVLEQLKTNSKRSIPVIVGGIIPDKDMQTLQDYGVAAVYTPKDFKLNNIMLDIANIVSKENAIT
jgi:(2R)-ethylmalonyl-CoA mutase